MAQGFQLRSPRLGDQGRWWEEHLIQLHARYAAHGRAEIWRTYPQFRHVRSLKGGQFIGAYTGLGPPDFGGYLSGGRAFGADAKEFLGDRWGYKDLREHQARQFDALQRLGAGAYLLIRSIDEQQGFLLPWREIALEWWDWRRTHGRAAPGTASLPLDELARRSVYAAHVLRFDYLAALVEALRHQVEAVGR